MSHSRSAKELSTCYHCGENCKDEDILAHEKHFCCHGCQMVYEILNESGLCDYYSISDKPGLSQKQKVRDGKFAFLDNEEIAAKLVHFSEGEQRHIHFYLPQMHCSSCIWLLEHLPRLNKGVISSRVDFLKKEITVIYRVNEISLRRLAELLTSVGYEPHISLHDMDSARIRKYDRSKVYKIGVAGFCFGNIMLLSFPDYFSSGDIGETHLKELFSYLNITLSLPVFFYCAAEFFTSAYKGLKQKFLNIDLPIALAILITFGRSLYEIISATGPGYLDSMSGIVFFMLIGRFFQDRTYQTLTFDRDYTSYFPVGVTVLKQDGSQEQKPVGNLRKGDRLLIHSHEIIPADGLLLRGKANIDYSFVTGESLPTEKAIGEIIYAGGKQVGGAIELEVVREVSQSYLTQLWNNEVFVKDKKDKKVSFIHRVSRYFTYVLFSLTIATAIYWQLNDPGKTWQAVTAMLIVACPCALLLSATFTNGSMLSKLQRGGFFVRNANALENIAAADTIVFDKTGTISMQGESKLEFREGALSEYEQKLVHAAASQSNHPLSKAIALQLPVSGTIKVKAFVEHKGLGISAVADGHKVMIGSRTFVCGQRFAGEEEGSRVFVSVNDELLGHFLIRTRYREGLKELVKDLKGRYRLALLSGDNHSEENFLRKIFGGDTPMLFNRDPQQKLEFIRNLQREGYKVIMIGDGLNDAGALMQSDAGIAVTEDSNNFSPACDAIMDGHSFSRLKKILDYCGRQKTIIYGSFILSVMYNIVGLSIAMQGNMSPVIAAILMPVSSISIVLYTTLASSAFAAGMNK